jgi:hypothetical protein
VVVAQQWVNMLLFMGRDEIENDGDDDSADW